MNLEAVKDKVIGLERGEITKLIVRGYKDGEFKQKDGEDFTVQFNPGEYNLSFETQWQTEQANNQTNADNKFQRIKPGDLSFSFTLDGTGASGEKIDVPKKLDEFLNLAHKYHGDKHKPRFIQVLWGTLDYKGVLKSVSIAHTLFTNQGLPLRVKVDVTVGSHQESKKQVQTNQPASPDMTHLRTIKDGDNLPLMCYDIYGDQQYYLDVAKVNRLRNYRVLETGTKLIFPPLKSLSNE